MNDEHDTDIVKENKDSGPGNVVILKHVQVTFRIVYHERRAKCMLECLVAEQIKAPN